MGKGIRTPDNSPFFILLNKENEKGELSAVCEIEKKIVREENGFEKMASENESEDGVI